MDKKRGMANEGGPEPTREEAVAQMRARMAADAKAPGGHVVYRRFRISGFWIALVATVLLLPILGMVVLAVSISGRIPSDFAFLLVLALPAPLVAAIIFAVRGRGDIAAGIVAGIGLLAVGLGITCFVAAAQQTRGAQA
jgi:hypothetical protein